MSDEELLEHLEALRTKAAPVGGHGSIRVHGNGCRVVPSVPGARARYVAALANAAEQLLKLAREGLETEERIERFMDHA